MIDCASKAGRFNKKQKTLQKIFIVFLSDAVFFIECRPAVSAILSHDLVLGLILFYRRAAQSVGPISILMVFCRRAAQSDDPPLILVVIMTS